MKTYARTWLVTAAMPLLLVACGDANEADKSPPAQVSSQEKGINSCALLTNEEIEAALGWKVATAEARDFGATGACTYSSSTPYSAQGFQQLSLVIGDGLVDISNSEAMAQWRLGQYSGESAKNPSLIVKPLEGLGVPAIQNGMASMFGIEIAVGDKLVTLSPFDALAPAQALAAKVIARVK